MFERACKQALNDGIHRIEHSDLCIRREGEHVLVWWDTEDCWWIEETAAQCEDAARKFPIAVDEILIRVKDFLLSEALENRAYEPVRMPSPEDGFVVDVDGLPVSVTVKTDKFDCWLHLEVKFQRVGGNE
jgi:hypothetical protein